MSETAISACIWLLFVFFCTASGSALTFVISNKSALRFFPYLSGFAVGVMLSASVWSLLIPAIESSNFTGAMKLFEANVGFLLGAAFMIAVCRITSRDNCVSAPLKNERTSFSRLFTAITMHNIPEGLAVGFAFGAVRSGAIGVASAVAVAFGIGVQNIPEGSAISLTARKFLPKKKAFAFGALSGIVEPIAGLLGFAEATGVLLPYLMAFSAGAMVFASVSDLLPEALASGKIKTAVGVALGFLLMMSLDVALG